MIFINLLFIFILFMLFILIILIMNVNFIVLFICLFIH